MSTVLVLAAGCASEGPTTVPYPSGPWSAGDQGTFMGSCGGYGGDSGYCKCALGEAMGVYPDTAHLPGSVQAGGVTAAQHKGDFPDCHG